MTSGRIFTAEDLTKDVDRSCDVCIIGSGAGGAVLGEALSALGHDVVMLEEGGYHTRRDFNLQEARAYVQLYQDFANRTTTDGSVTLLQGRTVGGGTTVNWTSCFRTPERILTRWRDDFGIRTLNADSLGPHWDAIEKRLHIAPWPEERMNRNNALLWEALGKRGYHRGMISRNVHQCANTGYCGLGCPLDAKQSMLVTYLPDAVRRGMTLYADTVARRIVWERTRVTAIEAEVLDSTTRQSQGTRVVIRPKVLCVSGGALNSPALLLRSGLNDNGRVGRRTFLHPVVVSVAQFGEAVEGFYGAPQSVYSHHFTDRGPGRLGYFLEVPPIHPMLASSLGGFGEDLAVLMEQLPQMQAMLGLTIDGLLPGDDGGTVGLRDGGARLDFQYPLRDFHWEAFRHAFREMAQLQFAVGAQRVYSPHTRPVVLESADDLPQLDAVPWEKLRVKVVTAHQMGGCTMGADPQQSVVDDHFRYRGKDNLFIVDGSVLPTALGVNPQQTIYGLAKVASAFVSAAV